MSAHRTASLDVIDLADTLIQEGPATPREVALRFAEFPRAALDGLERVIDEAKARGFVREEPDHRLEMTEHGVQMVNYGM